MNDKNGFSIGSQWSKALTKVPPLFDHSANLTGFMEDRAALEQRAEEYFEGLKSEQVREGVSSCISRGSNALGFEVPAVFVATMAFLAFRDWALRDDMQVFISGFEGQNAESMSAQLTLLPA